MVDTRNMFCDGCKKQVPITDIKYMPKGKDGRAALCKECVAKANGAIPEQTQKSNPFLSVSKPKPQAQPKPLEVYDSKISYICGKCKYKFKYDTEKGSPLRCPYCGTNDNLQQTKTSVNSLLSNSGY